MDRLTRCAYRSSEAIENWPADWTGGGDRAVYKKRREIERLFPQTQKFHRIFFTVGFLSFALSEALPGV
jgi:hypothetical protein